MNRSILASLSLDQLRHSARQKQVEATQAGQQLPYTKALDAAARDVGFDDWRHAQKTLSRIETEQPGKFDLLMDEMRRQFEQAGPLVETYNVGMHVRGDHGHKRGVVVREHIRHSLALQRLKTWQERIQERIDEVVGFIEDPTPPMGIAPASFVDRASHQSVPAELLELPDIIARADTENSYLPALLDAADHCLARKDYVRANAFYAFIQSDNGTLWPVDPALDALARLGEVRWMVELGDYEDAVGACRSILWEYGLNPGGVFDIDPDDAEQAYEKLYREGTYEKLGPVFYAQLHGLYIEAQAHDSGHIHARDFDSALGFAKCAHDTDLVRRLRFLHKRYGS